MHLDLPGSLSRKGKRLYTGCGKGLCNEGHASQSAEKFRTEQKGPTSGAKARHILTIYGPTKVVP
jgi:hypothetical protein